MPAARDDAPPGTGAGIAGGRAGAGTGFPADLRLDPRPAASRAALAASHPRWGLATMSLLVVGLVVGLVSMRPGGAFAGCALEAHPASCPPRLQVLVMVLPVASLVAGLSVSLLGGRLLLRLGRSPLVAAGLGWALFLLGAAVAYAVGGTLG